VSGGGMAGLFPALPCDMLINLSLLLMLAAIVYALFDITDQQPSLVVRLAGLALVTLLAILGMAGIYNVDLMSTWVVEQTQAVVEDTRAAIRAGRPQGAPEAVAYVLAWPAGEADGRLVYAREPGFDPQPLLQEHSAAPAPASWGYYIESGLHKGAGARSGEIYMRYGEHPAGSYYQYAGYQFDLDGGVYEIGLRLDELSRATQAQSLSTIWDVLASALFVLLVFPLFFRANLIRPLESLLAGVRQADAGDLNVQVAVTHNDEVGYLATAFNKMLASLRQELDGRQSAEAGLRRLNLTLEERVANRTRELEALYEVTAASSQARDSQALFIALLERSLAALRTSLGFVLLFEEGEKGPGLKLAAALGLPSGWFTHLAALQPGDEWLTAVSRSAEPVLLADTCRDERTPPFMRQATPLAMILAPLQAEGRPLGILGLGRPAAEAFDLDEVALSVSIVNQVGMAVHADQLRQRVHQASVLAERQRLARDLHDSVTQSLYGLVTLTEVGLMRSAKAQDAANAGAFQQIGQTARQAIREMRLFIHQLRPPDLQQEGLAGALDLRLAAVEGRSDVKARLIADEDVHLSLVEETAFYHIAQEALNNALKHARASNVVVTLGRVPRGVALEIVDDGLGFDPRQEAGAGTGLDAMQERAREIGACLEILSQPGQGTRVTAILEVQP
ncbi:MAG: HAMP domain-containing protein, partial [Chloroflexi bacterium]|nr:HAMP domain-containing protein [Chloroflexota bacterium]